jgi:hypothetical protein
MASKKSSKTSVAKRARTKNVAPHRSSTSASTKATRVLSHSAKSSVKSSAKPIEVKQSSDYGGNDWWNWSVWIEAPARELDQIEYVEYTLHPTFPDRVRRQTNRAEKFRIDSAGWGEFNIKVEVKPREGKPLKMEHWLTLEYPDQTSSSVTSTPAPSSKEGKVRPAIFLSAGVSDLRMGNALGEALRKEGFEVLKMDDSLSLLPWDVALAILIKQAGLMVMLVSGGLTSWATREIDAAINRKLPILPIVIGSLSVLPDQLQGFQTINLKDASDPAKIAPRVAKQIKDSIKF